MNDEIVTLKVRATASFREKLALTAKENNRSMNAEIIARLEESFEIKEQQEFDKAFVLSVIEDLQNQVQGLTNFTKQLMAEKNKGA